MQIMSEKQAAEQRVSLSGSGALSHVYIQHPPLRCSIPGTRGIYYDDGNKLILSPTSDQVLSWKVGTSAQFDPPNSDYIGEGPILTIRYSLDRKLIAVQRSGHELHFTNRETGEAFAQKYRSDHENILGFFWTDCPSCDVVVIKTSGLDLLSYDHASNVLRLVEGKRLNVSWYVYTHESRMVLLASGMQCNVFSGFQFSSVGIVRLPKFEMKMAKTEANHKPVLAAEDVNIVTIYGRIYCLQLDKVDMQLHVYRFYRDAVVDQGSLPIYSTRLAVSVVDNVLLVHQVDAKVVILYDIFLDSLAPISAPLPLLLRGAPRGSSGSQSNIRQSMPLDSETLSAYEGMIFGDSWRFFVPDIVCDTEHGLLWKIHVDVEAIAASSSEVPFILEFLQRRRSEPMKIKQLCLAMMRTIILERRPISMISRAFNVLSISYSQDNKIQNTSQKAGSRFSSDERGESSHSNQYKSNSVAMADGVAHKTEIRQGSLKSSQDELEQYTNKAEWIEPTGLSSASTVINPPADLVSGLDENIKERKTPSEAFLAKSSSGASSSLNEMEISAEDMHPGNIDSVDKIGSSNHLSDIEISSPVTSAAVSPDDLHRYVFSLVEEEMAGEPSFLVAIIVEFLRSVALEKAKVSPDIYVMLIRILARENSHAELGYFVINKIVEPSKEVAWQLIESGRQNIRTRKLGIDMLRQLSLHHEYLEMLLKYDYYLEALRYARKKKVSIGEPSLYLQAALSRNNHQHLAAVLRFFSDYIPGFQNTSDYNKYYHVLNEIS